MRDDLLLAPPLAIAPRTPRVREAHGTAGLVASAGFAQRRAPCRARAIEPAVALAAVAATAHRHPGAATPTAGKLFERLRALRRRGANSDRRFKPGARSPGPPSGRPGLRIRAPALQGPRSNAHFPGNHLQRGALRRQQPCNRSVLECLSVSSHSRPSSPPLGSWFYWGDNDSAAGGPYARARQSSPRRPKTEPL